MKIAVFGKFLIFPFSKKYFPFLNIVALAITWSIAEAGWDTIESDYINPCLDLNSLRKKPLKTDEDAKAVCKQLTPLISCIQPKVNAKISSPKKLIVDPLLGVVDKDIKNHCKDEAGSAQMLSIFNCLFVNERNRAALKDFGGKMVTFGRAAKGLTQTKQKFQAGCVGLNLGYKKLLSICKSNCDANGLNAVKTFFDRMV